MLLSALNKNESIAKNCLIFKMTNTIVCFNPSNAIESGIHLTLCQMTYPLMWPRHIEAQKKEGCQRSSDGTVYRYGYLDNSRAEQWYYVWQRYSQDAKHHSWNHPRKIILLVILTSGATIDDRIHNQYLLYTWLSFTSWNPTMKSLSESQFIDQSSAYQCIRETSCLRFITYYFIIGRCGLTHDFCIYNILLRGGFLASHPAEGLDEIFQEDSRQGINGCWDSTVERTWTK